MERTEWQKLQGGLALAVLASMTIWAIWILHDVIVYHRIHTGGGFNSAAEDPVRYWKTTIGAGSFLFSTVVGWPFVIWSLWGSGKRERALDERLRNTLERPEPQVASRDPRF
jgi:hypothetical protein